LSRRADTSCCQGLLDAPRGALRCGKSRMDWLALAAMLGLVGIVRISLWQYLGFYD
jgi:hypothetical protein